MMDTSTLVAIRDMILQTLGPTLSVLTALGMMLGLYWFLKRRRLFPKADITHEILARPLGDGRVLVRVIAVLKNSGDVIIRIESGLTRLCRLPGPGQDAKELFHDDGNLDCDKWGRAKLRTIHEVRWEERAEIEPTETHRFAFDFAVPVEERSINAYTCLRNEKKTHRGMFWTAETIYDIPDFTKAGEEDIMTETNEKTQGMRKSQEQHVPSQGGVRPSHETKQETLRPSYPAAAPQPLQSGPQGVPAPGTPQVPQKDTVKK